MNGFQAAYRDTCQSVLVGFEYGILFRAVVDQPPVLKLGVMTAGFPLQNLRPVLRLIAGRTFTNYLEYLILSFRFEVEKTSCPFGSRHTSKT